jgi:acetoacetate decarboxylase
VKTDSNKFYMVPLIWGPMVENEEGLRYHFGEIETIAIQYQTDPNAIGPLLPNSYRPADKPTVTVWFGEYNKVDFMGDRGYRVAAVQVAVRFDGTQDHLEGDYVVVMFENNTIPIIGGREQSGVPKIYADIAKVEMQASGLLHCEASLWGQQLITLDLGSLKKQNALVRFAASKMINSRPWLTYKYIPTVIGPHEVEYPMVFPSDIKIEELWRSRSGELSFGDPSKFRENNFPKWWVRLVEVLNTLPVRSINQCVRFSGSSVLRADLCHRLR